MKRNPSPNRTIPRLARSRMPSLPRITEKKRVMGGSAGNPTALLGYPLPPDGIVGVPRTPILAVRTMVALYLAAVTSSGSVSTMCTERPTRLIAPASDITAGQVTRGSAARLERY
jgi:hypothetical protein